MADTMQFDLVSPERMLVSTQASEVQIPGAEGELTAMPGHAPAITTLRPGILKVIAGGQTTEYAVTGGFAEISAEGVTVMAERSLPRAEMTPEKAPIPVRRLLRAAAPSPTRQPVRCLELLHPAFRVVPPKAVRCEVQFGQPRAPSAPELVKVPPWPALWLWHWAIPPGKKTGAVNRAPTILIHQGVSSVFHPQGDWGCRVGPCCCHGLMTIPGPNGHGRIRRRKREPSDCAREPAGITGWDRAPRRSASGFPYRTETTQRCRSRCSEWPERTSARWARCGYWGRT